MSALVQNIIDLLAAGFVFLLFASVYRKRRTVTVRFWMTGWFFILVHFAAPLFSVATPLGSQFRDVVSLGSLVFCGVAFVLSRREVHSSVRTAMAAAAVLGIPWMGAVICCTLPQPSPGGTAFFAAVALGSMLFVALRWFRTWALQLAFLLLVTAGCAAWLALAFARHDPDLTLCIVLTEVFSFNAVLLSFGCPRVSTATATVSGGAVTWSAVWICASLLAHFAPHAQVSPEIWNLPKYLVAAGMILTLLEDEIESASLASEQYRLLFASNPHAMWMYDPETFEFLEVNEAAVAQYGYTSRDFASMSLLDVFLERESPILLERLRGAGPQQLSGPWVQRRKDGSMLQADIASQSVMREGRSVMFVLMHDVTERERLHAQLVRQAHHDGLTDLPNRNLFEQRLEDALATAGRLGTKVALFCVDLDRFKQINDTYGHAAGDLCLKEVSARVSRRLQHRGTLARSGGDEFMLFLDDLRSATEAEAVASLLLRDLKAPVQLGSEELEIASSIGFAVFPDDGTEGEQLWRDADAAMYQAKRAGGAQWVRVSTEISSSASQANDIEVGLRRALKTGDLELHYQPQMTPDGHLHSFEALFRSPDPALRNVPTDRIIAIAEESNLIVALGNWVLEEACRQCRAWLDEQLPAVQVAVNVSPLQLTRFDFSRQVARLLERYHLSARMLEFEVTESTMMPDRGGDAPHQIATLARMGIRFSVDDFGTGYSSLGRLHQLPVDCLKIDRSFTRRIADGNGTYPTVDAIIALAHTFGMKVVAEGVETEEQLRLLKALRCDRMQGFLFGYPLPGDATTDFLRNLYALNEAVSVA